MKKSIISIVLAVVMIIGIIPLAVLAAISPETDIPALVPDVNGVYHIKDSDDLTKFGNMVTTGSNTFEDKTVVLEADITVKEQIGNWAEDGSEKYFAGTFDGNGHTITFTNTDITGNKGVFAYTVGAEISNLKIDGEIKGDWSLGGVVGCAKDTKITNCENRASVASAGTGNIAYAGGIVGVSEGGNVISGCKNYGSITGNKAIGGIIGEARVDDEIINCINEGAVSGNLYIGGILGNTPDKDNTITVKNCINYGAITATDGNAGGIAGHMAYSGTLVNCFTSGKVGANGGIVVG